MKKLLTVVLGLFLAFQVSNAQGTVQQLPANAQEFIANQFPNSSISNVKVDKDDAKSKYEVKLADGIEIDFNKKGDWTEIDCKNLIVPASLVPAAVAQYVQQQYADASIVKIERDRRGYEVKLSTGLELKFDSNGKFIKIDR